MKEFGDSELIKISPFSCIPKLAPIYVGVSRKSFLAERADELSTVMSSLQESGVLDKIAERYAVTVR